MTWYLQSRPGRPLHLSIWVADRSEHQDRRPWKTGGTRPLCGAVADGWRFTGPLDEKWRARPVCKHCLSELRKLNAAAGGDPE